MKKIHISSFIILSVIILIFLSESWEASASAQVELKSVSLRTIKLEPGGEPVTITMKGQNLNLIDSVKIFRGSREYREVKVRLGRASSSSLRVELSASSSAKPYCCLSLQFKAGKQIINASQKYMRVEIVASEMPAPSQPIVKPAAEVKVSSVNKRQIELEPGGRSADVTIQGINLDQITAVQVLFNRRITQDVEVRLQSGSLGSRGVKLRASSKARPNCCYALRLIANKKIIDVPESLLRIQVKTLSPVQDPVQHEYQMAESDTELWRGPEVTYFPEQGYVGSVIEVRGRSLGDPSQPEKTKVVFSYGLRVEDHPVEGEIVSVDYRSLRVKVPSGARKKYPCVITPGGKSWAPNAFDPLYMRHWSSNIFTAQGTLGSLTHIYESRFVFAHGENNSAFFPSNELITLGMNPYYFTYIPYQQRIDLLVGSTILRVRIPGKNRLRPSEVLETNSFRMLVDGKSLKIRLGFESSGTEFIGEYETQDVLTGKIHWKHFMNININNLVVDMTLQIQNQFPYRLLVSAPRVSSSFSASFSIFDTPSFDVDETPIKDFIQSELEKNVRAFLNSDDFRVFFGSLLTKQVKDSFNRTPVVAFKAVAANDGGLTFIGYTTYDN